MFRDMRRNSQKLTDEESVSILQKATSGVLAVIGDEDYPYAVPLSYVYCDFKIYIHCATQGHKLDAITKCPKVSFCVIDRDDILAEKLTTLYKSVTVFGKAEILFRHCFNAFFAPPDFSERNYFALRVSFEQRLYSEHRSQDRSGVGKPSGSFQVH